MGERKRKETRAEFFARNAQAGRTVRFSVTIDLDHVPASARKTHKLPGLGAIKIRNGTLTPKKAATLLDLLFGKARHG